MAKAIGNETKWDKNNLPKWWHDISGVSNHIGSLRHRTDADIYQYARDGEKLYPTRTGKKDDEQ